MNRVNRILHHPMWKGAIMQITEFERQRPFCGHGPEHLLQVARLAYIENLEQNWNISKELIYGAALLHDIGRGIQYTDGIPHEEAGYAMASRILDDCGFGGNEKDEILDAVRNHREGRIRNEGTLRGLIFRADKLSRNCFSCEAEKDCNWSREKKNWEIER